MPEGETITIDLGNPNSPYPPAVAAENVDKLRHWISKHTTVLCAMGEHEFFESGCGGICALGSQVVDERPCLCPCHAVGKR